MRSFFKFLRCAALLLVAVQASGAETPPTATGDAVSVVEGEIGPTSVLNYNSDYPDCYVVAQFKIQNIISGPPTPQYVNLAIPAVSQYKKTRYAALKQGTKLRATVISRPQASPKEVATQQADDFNDFTRETYFLRKGDVIYSYAKPTGTPFVEEGKYVSTYDEPLNEPQTPAAEEKRREQIARDLEKIAAAAPESTIPKSDLQQKWAAVRDQHPQFQKGIYWFQNGTGVFALPGDLTPYWDNDVLGTGGTREALGAICELDRFLKNKNVHLIVVLYPRIYPLAIRARFEETASIPIKENCDVARELLKNGVETVDLAPEMVKLIPKSEFLLYYYHLNDHPGWETQDLAGKLLAPRLERYELQKTLDPGSFGEKRVQAVDWKGYVYPSGVPVGGHTPGDVIKTNGTFYKDRPTVSSPGSPVLLWGNSFLSWPKNFALATAVAKYSLQFPEFRQGAGCFTSMIKDLFLSPQFYLNGKKVMIVPVSIDFLTGCKFYNVKELDEMLRINASGRVVQRVGLPPEHDRKAAFGVFARHGIPDAESSGKAYKLQGAPLQIPVPARETAAGKKCYLRAVLANNSISSVTCGGNKKTLRYPGAITWETIYFPYDPKAGKLVVHSKDPGAAVLIKEIAIVEAE